MSIVSIALTLLIGYLLGSIATGVLISRVVNHTDVRTQGSGNSGTTNVLRVMGKKYALLTLAGDMLKGIVAALIGRALLGGVTGAALGAFAAVLGHSFPIFFGFKGGKGIATGFGSLLAIFPLQTLCAFGVFLILVAITHYVSVGSLGAAITIPFFIILSTPCDTITSLSVIGIALLVIWRHRQNIDRLVHHTERKLDLHSKKK